MKILGINSALEWDAWDAKNCARVDDSGCSLFVDGKHVKDSFIDNLNNFFKITTVRNPYDRIVSQYNFEITALENHLKMFEIAKV